ncbi:MAG TPA: hypothetical protein VHX15_14975 [Frankiaceae bacterium]|jgi:hypothetical protein|nr:hypothetical protein [Frankiaceae bacterium]
MTIRVTRLRRQYYNAPLLVFLDGRPVGKLAPSHSGDIQGNRRPQELSVKCEGFTDGPPLAVTDPGPDLLLGVLVTYTKHRKLFARTTKSLQAEVMGPPISLPSEDPAKG